MSDVLLNDILGFYNVKKVNKNTLIKTPTQTTKPNTIKTNHTDSKTNHNDTEIKSNHNDHEIKSNHNDHETKSNHTDSKTNNTDTKTNETNVYKEPTYTNNNEFHTTKSNDDNKHLHVDKYSYIDFHIYPQNNLSIRLPPIIQKQEETVNIESVARNTGIFSVVNNIHPATFGIKYTPTDEKIPETDFTLPEHDYFDYSKPCKLSYEVKKTTYVSPIKTTTPYRAKVQLNMIVKNSGEKLKAMIESWKPILHNWTIMDTGSTDGTQELIKKCLGDIKGCLYEEPFVDFEISRNRSLFLCSPECDYIVCMDDTYNIANPEQLLIKLSNVDKTLEAFQMKIFTTCMNNKKEIVHAINYMSIRIIRSTGVFTYPSFAKKDNFNLEGYNYNGTLRTDPDMLKWIYPIHEVINIGKRPPVILDDGKLVYIDDIIDEYHSIRSNTRFHRDLNILTDMYRRTRNEYERARYTYYAGRTAAALQKYDLAVKWFEKRLTMHGNLNDDYISLIELGKIKGDRSYFERGINLFPNRGECYYYAAQFEYTNNNYATSHMFLLQGFEFSKITIPDQYMADHEIINYLLPIKLAEVGMKLGNHKTSLEAIHYAKKHKQSKELDELEFTLTSIKINNKPTIMQEHEECVVFVTGPVHTGPWDGDTKFLRGSETSVQKLAKYLAKNQKKFKIYVCCETPSKAPKVIDDVNYFHIDQFENFIKKKLITHLVIFRFAELTKIVQPYTHNIFNYYIWTQDMALIGNLVANKNQFRSVIALTDFHKKHIARTYGIPDLMMKYVNNGIDLEFIKSLKLSGNKTKYSFIYSSDANRGLFHLLRMFNIIKLKYPSATLTICCSLEKTDLESFPEGMRAPLQKELEGIRQMVKMPGVIHKNYVNKDELYRLYDQSEYWLYPNTFVETFCITALEAQYFKCKIITTKLGALPEVIKTGYFIDPNNMGYENYLKHIDDKFDLEANYKHACSMNYEKIMNDWMQIFTNFYNI